jgi:hypothetical protein
MPELKKVNHLKQGDYKHLTAVRSLRLNKDIKILHADKGNCTVKDPVSETLCFMFVEIRTMDKVQKLNSNECYTPSSEPFRMYW